MLKWESREPLIKFCSTLKEGHDYGRIHMMKKDKCSLGKNCKNPAHFTKPILFKPGAEKIISFLGLRPDWPAVTQYETAAVEGREIKDVVLRCILYRDDIEVGMGVGGRSTTQDYGDLNKTLKMAKKSSFVDATLTIGGLSELYTQDLEDMISHHSEDIPDEPATPGTAPAPEPDKPRPAKNPFKKLPPIIITTDEERAQAIDALTVARKAWELSNPGRFKMCAKSISETAQSLNDLNNEQIGALITLVDEHNRQDAKVTN